MSTPRKTTKTIVKSKDKDSSATKIRRRVSKDTQEAHVISKSQSSSKSKALPLSKTNHTYTEEDEVDDRDPLADLKLQKDSCQEIRNVISKIRQIKEKGNAQQSEEFNDVQMHGVLQFCALKKLNRLSHIRSKKAKDATNAAKMKIDQHNLELQNLLYEVMHLQKEIDKCLQFKSKDEDLNLVDVDTFYAEAPKEISKPKESKADPHLEMLARLDWELQERKSLSDRLKCFDSQCQEINKEIENRLQTVNSLMPQLQAVLDATQPMQEYLGLPIDATREQHQTACYLSRPLYVLYRQLTGYRDACDHTLTVTIEGDLEAAKALHNTPSDEDEDSDSDVEDTEKTTKRSRRASDVNRRENKLNKTLKLHPLSVCVQMHFKEDSERVLRLSFRYMIVMDIVTVTATWADDKHVNRYSSISASDLLSPSSLLSCLYSGDTGLYTPNPANSFLQQKLGMDGFGSYVSKVGYAYCWAQQLSGLQFLALNQHDAASACLNAGVSDMSGADAQLKGNIDTRGSDNASTSTSDDVSKREIAAAKHMRVTLKKIMQRVTARVALSKQFYYLEKGELPVFKSDREWFPPKICTHLVSWKRSVYEDFIVLPHCKPALDAAIATPQQLYFIAALTRGAAHITAQVVLDVNYPSVAPLFVVEVNWKGKRNALNDHHIRELESEVNLHYPELINPDDANSSSQLLTNQLQRLAMCIDIYLECDEIGAVTEFKKEKMFSRPARGPLQSRPYQYHGKLGFFTHR